MDWNAVLAGVNVVALIGVGVWAGMIKSKLDQSAKVLEQLSQVSREISRDVSEVRVALSNLRAELYEKFQPRTTA